MSAQQKIPQINSCQPSMGLPFEKELVVDLLAGGGGASTGISVAVNHNPIALAVHRANHPQTAHYVADVFEVDPVLATGGQPVGIPRLPTPQQSQGWCPARSRSTWPGLGCCALGSCHPTAPDVPGERRRVLRLGAN